MTTPRATLAAAAAAVVTDRPTGVAGLLAGLHRTEPTARLAIEAIALPPVPLHREGRALLVALLAVPVAGSRHLHRPFGAVTWDPTDGSVVELQEWGVSAPPWAPAGPDVWPATGAEDELRALCMALDRAVAGPAPADLPARYRAALPEPAIVWYRAMLAGSTSLLDPPAAPDGIAGTEVDRTRDDVTAELGGWIRQLTTLATEANAPHLVAELDVLAGQRSRPGFRIAVVGEFNRGKSTLVNRLVGAEVAPTGPIPTTTGFLVVRAGDPAEDAHDESGDTQRTVDSAWLAAADTEIVDTPGTNESGEDRTAEVRRAITLSDGVLMAVSAASPLSRTERELLEHEVLRRRVPFLAVVVGFLDQLDEPDALTALDSVRVKVAQLAPHAPVLRGPGLTDGERELEALRELITKFAALSGNRRWRSRKIATAVADVAGAVADVAGEAAAAAAIDDAARRTAIAREQAALARDSSVWDGLRVDLDSRRRQVANRIREALASDVDPIVEALHHELLRAPDPGQYWERDAAYRLRRELVALTRKYETIMISGMAADLDWLDARLAEQFGVPGATARPLPGLVAPDPVLPAAEVSDLSRRRLLSRIGAAGGTMAGYVLGPAVVGAAFPPFAIAMAGGLVAAVLAERSLRSAAQGQRETVDGLLRQAVEAAVTEVSDLISARLRSMYTEITDGLGARHRAWRADRLAALRQPAPTAAPLATLAGRAAALDSAIRTAVAGDSGSLEES